MQGVGPDAGGWCMVQGLVGVGSGVHSSALTIAQQTPWPDLLPGLRLVSAFCRDVSFTPFAHFHQLPACGQCQQLSAPGHSPDLCLVLILRSQSLPTFPTQALPPDERASFQLDPSALTIAHGKQLLDLPCCCIAFMRPIAACREAAGIASDQVPWPFLTSASSSRSSACLIATGVAPR